MSLRSPTHGKKGDLLTSLIQLFMCFVPPYPALAGEGGLLLTPSYNLSILALVVSERLLFSYNSSVRMIVYPWKVRFVPL